MANLGVTFNAADVAPSQPMSIIPPGDYQGEIVNSEMRATKDGTGQYLWLEIAIRGGEYENRRVFDRLNLVNANPQTAQWAQEALSAICHATGQMQVSDSEQLHGRLMTIVVKVRPARGDYDAQNEVKGYKPASGVVAPRTSAGQAAPRPVAPFPGAKPAAAKPASAPWRRTAA